MLGEDKPQAKGNEDQEEAGFEIVAAMQKAVPGPEVLGERIAEQDDGCEEQEKAAQPGVKRSGAENFK